MTHANRLTRLAKPTSRQLLARILDDSELIAAVKNLPPRVLGKLIHHIGLEDASELVSLASAEQLRQIFDDDLWHSKRPGQDETFDPDRFALWLEVMLEVGEDFTAEKLVELPEDLVVLALHRHILVLNIDRLAVGMASRQADDDLIEKVLESCLYQEFDEYRVISRHHNGWDAILAVLLALDQKHFDFLQRVLERCCQLSTEYIEDNGGLFEVLSADETLDADVAAEREDRRARVGYIAPSSAAAFLRLASTTDPSALAADDRDPITRAYFRELDREPKPAPRTVNADSAEKSPAPVRPDSQSKLLALLKEEEILKDASPQLLIAGDAAGSKAQVLDTLLKQALQELAMRDPVLHGARLSELAYLTNVLYAGCSFAGRSFRLFDAALAVMAVCNLGLEHLGTPRGASQVLSKRGADQLFRIGWQLLYKHVVLATSRVLEQALSAKAPHLADRAQSAQSAQLAKVSQALRSAIAAGRPWSARRKLEALDILFDEATLTALKALIDECPSLAGALRTDAGPAKHEPEERPQFLRTADDLRKVQSFLNSLFQSET